LQRQPTARTRLGILWHAARYRLSVTSTACVFAVTRQTVIHWRRALGDKNPSLLPPPGRLPDLVRELARRLKAEWPRWGTRRIAGQLAQLGIQASRSSVQRLLQRPRAPEPDDRLLPVAAPGLLAKRPNHIWMIDFTRLGGSVRPAFVGAVIDAFSRRVLAIGFVRGLFLYRPKAAIERRPPAVRALAQPGEAALGTEQPHAERGLPRPTAACSPQRRRWRAARPVPRRRPPAPDPASHQRSVVDRQARPAARGRRAESRASRSNERIGAENRLSNALGRYR